MAEVSEEILQEFHDLDSSWSENRAGNVPRNRSM